MRQGLILLASMWAALTLLPGGAQDPPGGVLSPMAHRPVTAAVNGQTLREALPTLGKHPRTSLRCGENAADRRIYLFVEEQPLSEVMGRLKKLIPYPPGQAFWFRSGSGSIFDEDIASRKARIRAAEKAKREYLARARASLQKVRKWAEGPEGPQAPASAQEDALRYLALFDQVPRAQQDRAFLGQTVKIPFRGLSQGGQTAYLQALQGGQPLKTLPRPVLDGLRRRAQGFGLTLGRAQQAPARVPSVEVILQTQQHGGILFEELLHVPTFDRSKSAEWAGVYGDERIGRRGPANMKEQAALQVRIKGSPRENRPEGAAGYLLPRLAREAGLPLIGEYDPCATPARFGERPGQRTLLLANWERRIGGKPDPPLWQVLEWACQDLDLYWDYEDGWIIIRSPRTVYSWAGMADLRPVPLPPL